ncbi:hypothetical protein M9H77_36259 [Catharanthus roseus]|uniref:Uncharacterized protein n=1 Tax=Catharanthus roseus TaxID=4058 RepID=A0ACB9ZRB4_CATRO|nr:hypothetical protein M9H77_36259 [Catharanthus roseus]
MIHQTIGFRFHPIDEEMLLLLRHKAQQNIINPRSCPMIVERHFYSENGTPWIIFKQDDPWQTLMTKSGKLIKDTKYLYIITRLKKISWIMHEYHLDGDFLRRISQTNDYVICRIKWEFCSNDSNGGSETPLLSSSSSSVLETAAPISEGDIKNGRNLENINNEYFLGFDNLINIEEIINGDEGKFAEKEISFIERVDHILMEEEDSEWGKFMMGMRSGKRLNNSYSYLDS